MDFKVGDFVEIHGLDAPGFNDYDRTFNGLKGRITRLCDDASIRVYFFKGQRRKWGEFDPKFIKPIAVEPM